SVFVLVVLWLLPTTGLFISSFRTADQIAASGWWSALFPQEQNLVMRAAAPSTQKQEGNLFVIEGNLFAENGNVAETAISAWGTSSRAIDDYAPGDTADMGEDGRVTVQENGDYRLENDAEFTGS